MYFPILYFFFILILTGLYCVQRLQNIYIYTRRLSRVLSSFRPFQAMTIQENRQTIEMTKLLLSCKSSPLVTIFFCNTRQQYFSHNQFFNETGWGMSKQRSCELCSETFANIRSFHNHKLSHGRKKKYKCNQCNKSFTSLKLHISFILKRSSIIAHNATKRSANIHT